MVAVDLIATVEPDVPDMMGNRVITVGRAPAGWGVGKLEKVEEVSDKYHG